MHIENRENKKEHNLQLLRESKTLNKNIADKMHCANGC